MIRHRSDDLPTAIRDLDEARRRSGEIERLVAEGKVGAHASATADWTLQQCLKRVERLQQQADYADPLNAA